MVGVNRSAIVTVSMVMHVTGKRVRCCIEPGNGLVHVSVATVSYQVVRV